MTPEFETRFPLLWPNSRPRTRAADRRPALFRHEGRRMTLTTARRRLADQVYAMTRNGQPWRTINLLLAINIRFTASDARDMRLSGRDPDDPGAAFYFDLDGRPHVLACDRWDTVPDNIAAIAAHIDALRGQERWGVADLAQAFAGHLALPAPDPWWTVLGISRTADPAEIAAAFRAMARTSHPDAGGDRAAWDRLNAAYAAARAERGA